MRVRSMATPSSKYSRTQFGLLLPLHLTTSLLRISNLRYLEGNEAKECYINHFPFLFPRPFHTLSPLLFTTPSTYIYIFHSIFLLHIHTSVYLSIPISQSYSITTTIYPASATLHRKACFGASVWPLIA